jgi:hypothetical protein
MGLFQHRDCIKAPAPLFIPEFQIVHPYGTLPGRIREPIRKSKDFIRMGTGKSDILCLFPLLR